METQTPTITCGLCFKALTKPLTFECTHSFCTECVRNYLTDNKDNGFVCPLCATPHALVRCANLGQYADVALETRIRRLSDGQFARPQCQWCEEAASTVQCGECMSTYCDDCCELAHKRPTKRNHVITKLNDSYRTFFRRCHQFAHEEYRAEFYCQECAEVCCAYCLQVGPHKDHENVPVAKAAAEARQQMTRDTQWLSQAKSKLETQTQELNRVAVTYAESYDGVEALISERFALFRQQLAQRELEVRRALGQLRESGDGALTTARKQYLGQLNAVNEGLLRFRGLQAGGADYDVLQNKVLLDSVVQKELPTITGTGFNLTNTGELALTGLQVQLDLQSADILRAMADASGLSGGEETTLSRRGTMNSGIAQRQQQQHNHRRNGSGSGSHYGTAAAGGHNAGEMAPYADVLNQPLRLTFPVDEDVEATVRPDGVFLRCTARGGGGVQIGVRSKEMLETILRAHQEDGNVVSWQVRLESISDTFLGLVEKTSRAVVPEGFYWKPACAGVTDGHLGRPTAIANRLPVCRSGDVVRFVYDATTQSLRIIVNDRTDCGVVLTDLHSKVAACFIFYPGESLTVLF